MNNEHINDYDEDGLIDDWTKLMNCNFDNLDSSMCYWNNDPRNSIVEWKVESIGLGNGMLCLKPRRSKLSLHSFRLSKQDGLENNLMIGRLWSETMMTKVMPNGNDNIIKCLKFSYLILMKNEPIYLDLVKLSLLKHSTG